MLDSRPADDGTAIRRRRSCPKCAQRFTTTETAMLLVMKRCGVTESFSRDKVIAGVRKACQGRPVGDDALALLAQQVEESVRSTGRATIKTQDIGLAILEPLQQLDEIAYLRFASVYRGFTTLEDFEGEIAQLRLARRAAASKVPALAGAPAP